MQNKRWYSYKFDPITAYYYVSISELNNLHTIFLINSHICPLRCINNYQHFTDEIKRRRNFLKAMQFEFGRIGFNHKSVWKVTATLSSIKINEGRK